MAWLRFVLLASMLLHGACADWFLLFPRRARYTPRAATRHLIAFEGGRLEAFSWPAPCPCALHRGHRRRRRGRDRRCCAGRRAKPQLYLLEFTGNAGLAQYGSSFAPALWPLAVEVWRVNYPGFGNSSKPYGLRRIGPAARAAFDALAQVAGSTPIVVAGNSMGCLAALHLAARRDVAGVVVANVPPLRELMLQRYGFIFALPFALQVPLDIDAHINARRTRGAPALFFTAQRDRLVPPGFQREVFEDYRGPRRRIVVRGAGHNSRLYRDRHRFDSGVRWLVARLRSSARR